METRILFTKWFNPFSQKSIEEMENKFYDEMEEEGNIDLEDNSEEMVVSSRPKQISVIATPMGFIPLTHNNSPDSVFNLWTCHVTCDITKPIFDAVEHTEGVELLNPLSRYRMMVGIGRLFKTGDVMRNIRENILAVVENGK